MRDGLFAPGPLLPFNPGDPRDAAAEAERRGFMDYFIKRLKAFKRRNPKLPDNENGNEAIAAMVAGSMTAICLNVFALNGGDPPEDALEAMHAVLDFAWLQATGVTCDGGIQ